MVKLEHGKPLKDIQQYVFFVQVVDHLLHFVVVEYVGDILREAIDVVDQILAKIGGVFGKGLKGER